CRPRRHRCPKPRQGTHLDRRQAGRDRRRVLADHAVPPARLQRARARRRPQADDPGAGNARSEVEGRAVRCRRLPGAGAGRAGGELRAAVFLAVAADGWTDRAVRALARSGSSLLSLAAMDATDARVLIDYIYWMRDRILESVERLPAHEFLSAK